MAAVTGRFLPALLVLAVTNADLVQMGVNATRRSEGSAAPVPGRRSPLPPQSHASAAAFLPRRRARSVG
jgi:hypothetical protein